MRKLILVAALATMWTSTCHANLSLASNAPVSTVADAKAQALETKSSDNKSSDDKAPEVKAPEARAPEARSATVAKSSSRPRRHFSSRAPIIRSFYSHCL
jgi:hypothetical protein